MRRILTTLIAGSAVLAGAMAPAQAAVGEQPPNANCTLVVPANPLTAAGLATPYQLRATDRNAGACHEANTDQAAFVEATVVNPDGTVGVYHPVVIDQGSTPAVPPVPVTLAPGATVGIWFGYNGDTLTFAGRGAGQVTGGLGRSAFGQFGYINATNFFQAAAAAKVKAPALGVAADGKPCPTTRDFSVVDQDQSDNTVTHYRIIGGKIAQDTAATANGVALANGSDENLLASFVAPAMGCAASVFKAPDLDDPGAMVGSLALNELSAMQQPAPMALAPLSDPMVLVNGKPSPGKLAAYRRGVGQNPNPNAGQTPAAYCNDLRTVGLPRLKANAARFNVPGPGGVNLNTFLTDRFATTLQLLKCTPPAGVRDGVGPRDRAHDGGRRGGRVSSR